MYARGGGGGAASKRPPGIRPLVTTPFLAAAKPASPGRGGDNQRVVRGRAGAGRGVTWGEGGNQVLLLAHP